MAFTAIYDACVLHPQGLRDLLVRLGMTGLFRARWTDQILDEMVGSVLRRYPDLSHADLARTRQLMCDAVPDSLVTGYEGLTEVLALPDPDDRHVLAAAIVAGAEVIVTDNATDFPPDALAPFNIETQTADDFVLHLVDLAPAAVSTVVNQQAADLRNPPMTTEEVLDRLAVSGLRRSVAALRHL
ncbi:PIN domain-containing protein [Candidatus Poriferisocius sp.]|uniref:PIN domain-containing protein n=1 Tax=Candidatus Poriferisocius sp. TaxID=3101276 RepID=UPI003B5A5881